MKIRLELILFLVCLNMYGMEEERKRSSDELKERVAKQPKSQLIIPLGDDDQLDLSEMAPIAFVSFAQLREEQAKRHCALMVARVKTSLPNKDVAKHSYEVRWLHHWLFGKDRLICPTLLNGYDGSRPSSYQRANPINGQPIKIGSIDYFILEPEATQFTFLCTDRELWMGQRISTWGCDPISNERKGIQCRNILLAHYAPTGVERAKAKTIFYESRAEGYLSNYYSFDRVWDYAHERDQQKDPNVDQEKVKQKLSLAVAARECYGQCVSQAVNADVSDKEFVRPYAQACANLGQFYSEGIGCEKNYDHALYYLERAIAQNINEYAKVKALRIRGELYYNKLIDSPHADQIAYESFLEADRALHSDIYDRDYARLYLAEIYFQGKGVQKDLSEARKYAEWIIYGGMGLLHPRAKEILAEVEKL